MSLLPPPEQPTAPKGGNAPSSASKPSGAIPVPKPSVAAKAEAAASGMLSSLRVSLMPSDLEGRPAPNITKGLVILAVVVLLETAVIGGLFFMTGRKVTGTIAERDKLIEDIARIDKETAALEAAATPAVTYAYQVEAAKDTLSKHVYWSPFFALLEKSTLPTVKYLSFAGDATTGVVTVDCFAGTYRDVAMQIISLREVPMILDVRSNAAAAKLNEKGEITGISFSMVIKLKPEAWSLLTVPSSMPEQQGNGTTGSTSSDNGGQPPAFQAAPTTPSSGATAPSEGAGGSAGATGSVPNAPTAPTAPQDVPTPAVPPQPPSAP